MLLLLPELTYGILFLLLSNPASHYTKLNEKMKIMEILTVDVLYANIQLFCILHTVYV